jgi:hypothetical protein
MEGGLQMKTVNWNATTTARENLLRQLGSNDETFRESVSDFQQTDDAIALARARHQWNSYYFSLVRSCLLFQIGDEVVGVIYLKYVTICVDAARIRSGKFQWRITTPNATYFIRCKHLASMAEWLHCVTNAPAMAIVPTPKEILSDLQGIQNRRDTLECALQNSQAFLAVKRALTKKEDKAALHTWQDIENFVADHEGEDFADLAIAQKLIARAQVLFPPITQLHGFQVMSPEEQLETIQQQMLELLMPQWHALRTKANWDENFTKKGVYDEEAQRGKLGAKQVKLVLRERLPSKKAKKAKYRGREIKTRTAILSLNSKSNRNQIGRGEESRLFKISDASVSRAHGRFDWKTKDALVYVDLGSQGGTKLNGRRIETAALGFGDVLKLSKHVNVTVTQVTDVSEDELWEKAHKSSCVVS